jgi:hypothetical protein
MRRFNHPHAFAPLLIRDLAMKRIHFGPMHLGPEMVFGMVAVIKPQPVVQFVVTADSPGNRLVRIASKMKIIAVQVGEAVPKIIKGQKEEHEMPVQHEPQHEQAEESHNFKHSPKSVAGIAARDFAINGFRIVPKIAQEDVRPDILRLALVSVPVNRKPVDAADARTRKMSAKSPSTATRPD